MPNILQATGADNGYLIRKNDGSIFKATPSYAYLTWNGNVTSSGGTKNQVNWIQGTYSTTGISLFSLIANNGIQYDGTRTLLHEITYTYTADVASNDRTVKFYAYKNPSAITNPAIGGLIAGSTTTSILRTSINDTDSVSSTFAVSLSFGDVIRFYVSNVENNDVIDVIDASIKIKNVY